MNSTTEITNYRKNKQNIDAEAFMLPSITEERQTIDIKLIAFPSHEEKSRAMELECYHCIDNSLDGEFILSNLITTSALTMEKFKYLNRDDLAIEARPIHHTAESYEGYYSLCIHFTPCGFKKGDTFNLGNKEFGVIYDGTAVETTERLVRYALYRGAISDLGQKYPLYVFDKDPTPSEYVDGFISKNNITVNGPFEKYYMTDEIESANNLYVTEGYEGIKEFVLPSKLKHICRCAFAGVKVDAIIIPDGVETIYEKAFIGSDISTIIYRGVDVTDYLLFDAYGENNFKILKTFLDNNVSLNMNIFEKAVDFAHRGISYIEMLKDYPIYGTLKNRMQTMSPTESEIKELSKAFKESEKFHGHAPKITKELIHLKNTLSLANEDIIGVFDVKMVKGFFKDQTPILPALICNLKYDKNITAEIAKNNLTEDIAEIIIKEQITKDFAKHHADNPEAKADYERRGENMIQARNWVVSHLRTDKELLSKVFDNISILDFYGKNGNGSYNQEMLTVDSIRNQITFIENKETFDMINEEYEIDIESECICCIPPMQTEYDGRTSRFLNFNDKNDLCLGANLGELTSCCQRLNEAGETAMMHGFLNPDAGFFVIEDSDKKVLAQAEVFLLDDKETLVFDNIEFANTDGAHYEERVKQLSGDIAWFSKNAPYKNIIMGCGYNDMDFSQMEAVEDVDEEIMDFFYLTPKELHLFDEDGEINSIEDAINWSCCDGYEVCDYVYTDVNGEYGSVYIKRKGEVSDYLMANFDKGLAIEPKESFPAYDDKQLREGIQKIYSEISDKYENENTPYRAGVELAQNVYYQYGFTLGLARCIRDLMKEEKDIPLNEEAKTFCDCEINNGTIAFSEQLYNDMKRLSEASIEAYVDKKDAEYNKKRKTDNRVDDLLKDVEKIFKSSENEEEYDVCEEITDNEEVLDSENLDVAI